MKIFEKAMMLSCVLMMLFFMPGCGDDLSKEDIAQLNTMATSAKERALTFENMKGGIVAVNPDHAEDIEKFKEIHSSILQTQASAYNTLLTAIRTNNDLNKTTRAELRANVDTARAHAEAFKLQSDNFKWGNEDGQETFSKWKEAHAKSLDNQVQELQRFVKKLE